MDAEAEAHNGQRWVICGEKGKVCLVDIFLVSSSQSNMMLRSSMMGFCVAFTIFFDINGAVSGFSSVNF